MAQGEYIAGQPTTTSEDYAVGKVDFLATDRVTFRYALHLRQLEFHCRVYPFRVWILRQRFALQPGTSHGAICCSLRR